MNLRAALQFLIWFYTAALLLYVQCNYVAGFNDTANSSLSVKNEDSHLSYHCRLNRFSGTRDPYARAFQVVCPSTARHHIRCSHKSEGTNSSLKFMVESYGPFELRKCQRTCEYEYPRRVVYNCQIQLKKGLNLIIKLVLTIKHLEQVQILKLMFSSVQKGFCLDNRNCINSHTCVKNWCTCPKNTILIVRTRLKGLYQCVPLKANIGDKCIDDEQCMVQHSKCNQSTGTCRCSGSFKSVVNDSGLLKCKATIQYGHFCQNSLECKHARIKNLTCTNNVCQCRKGYKFQSNFSCKFKEDENKEFIPLMITCALVVAILVLISGFILFRRKCY